MKLKNKLVGLSLLGVAFSSSALSLGRARGNVVLGQPLSLAVEVRVDQIDEATAQCFRVEVFHGDNAVEAGRVRLVVQPPAAGSLDAVLRIRSSVVVDEPVLGVTLHALCGQRGMRHYDFLPEFPPELQASQTPVGSAAAPAVVRSVPIPAPSANAEPGAVATPVAPATTVSPRIVASPQRAPAQIRPARPAAQAAAAPPRRAAPPRPAAPKAVAAAPAPAPASAAATPRLTLDAPPAGANGLRPTPDLVQPATDNPVQREQATAVWRALGMAPEDIARSLQRLDALEAQQTARAAQVRADSELRARLEAAERRLDEAERGRVDILLAYGLLGLLLLAIAAAAYFWYRSRQAALAASAWAGAGGVAGGAGVAADPDVPFAFRPSAVSKTSLAEEFFDSEPASALGERASTPSARVAVSGLDSVAAAAAVFSPDKGSKGGAAHAVHPDEFFDVQQHADFFVSLGQYEQAIEVLKTHLQEHADMSPLAFLELFKIYQQLGRQSDFNVLRDRFHGLFNARVPSFAALADEGLSLEDYPAAMLSIETAWGDARVLDTIEANLLRHAGDTGRPLDLAAYRDLLLLYGIAQAVFRAREGSRPLSIFGERVASIAAPLGGSARAAAGDPPTMSAPAHGISDSAMSTLDLVPDSSPAALPPLDDGLVLDLDLSSDLVQLPERDHNTGVAEVDIDLPLLDFDAESLPAPKAPPAPAPKPSLDSGLIDFDLFDPNTEAQIAPKSRR